MISHDEVVAAHEQSYRVMRAGLWNRRVGLGALLLGLTPPIVHLGDHIWSAFHEFISPPRLDRSTLVTFTVCAVTAVGGFVQRRFGRVMHEVSGTRNTDAVRRACAIAAIGALLASAPALVLIGAVAVEAMRGGTIAVGACGLCCGLPIGLPLLLMAENGRLWLHYPNSVETIIEGRAALRPEPPPARDLDSPTPPPPIIVPDDDADEAP